MAVTWKNERITPKTAKLWLAKSRGNRKISQAKVNQYARDIALGRFLIGTDDIGFTESGVLVNGHQRLMAIIQAGISLNAGVKRGLDEGIYVVLDRGKPRRPADTLDEAGFSNSDLAAAIIRMTLNRDAGRTLMDTHQGEEILAYADLETNVHDIAARVSRLKTKALRAGVGVVLHLATRGGEHLGLVDQVIEGLRVHEQLPGSSPLAAFSWWLVKQKRLRAEDIAANFNVAWNAFVNGSTVTSTLFKGTRCLHTMQTAGYSPLASPVAPTLKIAA